MTLCLSQALSRNVFIQLHEILLSVYENIKLYRTP